MCTSITDNAGQIFRVVGLTPSIIVGLTIIAPRGPPNMPLAGFGLILGFNLSTGIVNGQFWHFCLTDKAGHLIGYILFLRRILRRN